MSYKMMHIGHFPLLGLMKAALVTTWSRHLHYLACLLKGLGHLVLLLSQNFPFFKSK